MNTPKALSRNTRRTSSSLSHSRRLFPEGLENRQVLAADMGPFLATESVQQVEPESPEDTSYLISCDFGTTTFEESGEQPVAANQSAMTATSAGEDVGGDLNSDLAADLHLNLASDHTSLETSVGADVASATDADVAATVDADADTVLEDLTGSLGSSTDLSISADVDASASADLNDSTNVDNSLEADIKANVDANLDEVIDGLDIDGLGLGTDLDIDTAITANLLLDSALNSSSNLGVSSLLNSDNNLNGSIGGSAALNLTGDANFDDLATFNGVSAANLTVDDAANLALNNSLQFSLANQAADDFFASLAGQNQLNVNANLNTEASLFANLSSQNNSQDSFGNLGLNSNINAGVRSVSQSRLGSLPFA
ncbi:hypothetical protein ETAA8_29140 [Anatilimnocola aggregata]|uniref:Uncharacterized protein n=1 Tax=Anatilimnocola aggregata TaxID=2528021 RepID=A0A517YC53_9BACT|nr:hypothetical protein [Anatilimnocola aggregata]QDU27823.1 hypothetical protein ETAA8_29140 [Anatilimnocola aggregata]